MLQSDKLIKALTTPYSALMSVIFGMMIVSFPIGAYVVFNTDIGREINFEYPLDGINVFLGGIGFKIPFQFELGDGFIVAWSAYLILFSISICGPNKNFIKSVSDIMSGGWENIKNNYLLSMLTWFSILVVFSIIIDSLQQSVGIPIEPPEFSNGLIQFFQITVSPLTEEIGFRMSLIGLPLFAMFARKASFTHFLKSLWHPAKNLEITNYKKAIGLVIIVGIFFGVSHIISGTPWSVGKVAQASFGGVIIGWVYMRYGLAPAILLHWATNYFVFSYVFFVSNINQTSITDGFTNPFLGTVEILLIIAGILAATLLVLDYLRTKKESTVTTV
ncbi:MAG TPA: CPBP family intramembrane glutamic endopeptidase [Nitrosopumilaceae archaeon]|nr:CPBP family intramembrane glutamic endopeptidase [Nitrosopumilaceae archaeon]